MRYTRRSNSSYCPAGSQVNLTTWLIDDLLITHKDRIASKAYPTALDLYDQNEQRFRTAFQANKLIGVKIIYFLNRVFQEFATDLSRFTCQVNSSRLASASPKGRQQDIVIQTPGPFLKYRVKPCISLSPGLVLGQRMGGGRTWSPKMDQTPMTGMEQEEA